MDVLRAFLLSAVRLEFFQVATRLDQVE